MNLILNKYKILFLIKPGNIKQPIVVIVWLNKFIMFNKVIEIKNKKDKKKNHAIYKVY